MLRKRGEKCPGSLRMEKKKTFPKKRASTTTGRDVLIAPLTDQECKKECSLPHGGHDLGSGGIFASDGHVGTGVLEKSGKNNTQNGLRQRLPGKKKQSVKAEGVSAARVRNKGRRKRGEIHRSARRGRQRAQPRQKKDVRGRFFEWGGLGFAKQGTRTQQWSSQSFEGGPRVRVLLLKR